MNNSNNPFDTVGIEHNRLVQLYLDTHGSSIMDRNAILNAFYTMCQADVQFTSVYPNAVYPTISDVEFDLWIDDFEYGFVNKINASTAATVKEKQHFINIIDIILQDQALLASQNAIIALEAQVLADTSLNSNEKESILTLSSIGRHSLTFWDNAFNGSGKSDDEVNAEARKSRKGKRRLLVAGGDVVGGVIGFFVGGILGTLQGGAAASTITNLLLPGADEIWPDAS